MFESHYGFSAPPFQLSPDPSFYFASKGHGQALSYLKYGVYQREGFIVVTGEIGSGKTTLVRKLLEDLDAADVVAAQVVNTQLDTNELLQAICMAFGVQAAGSSKAQMLGTLEAYFTALAANGRRALLIVDEAQNLGLKEVEELRMLSNFQLGNQALMQTFLVGQPELRKMLHSASMEQLRQRVIASCHLGPMSVGETRGYIEHRLRKVGWVDRPQLGEVALAAIHRRTGGIPRRINVLCTRALLAGWLAESQEITPENVAEAAAELGAELAGEDAAESANRPPERSATDRLPS
ncbi:XrtA/PEP-CTERM system-associated ATPase [Rhizobacter fulvus]